MFGWSWLIWLVICEDKSLFVVWLLYGNVLIVNILFLYVVVSFFFNCCGYFVFFVDVVIIRVRGFLFVIDDFICFVIKFGRFFV